MEDNKNTMIDEKCPLCGNRLNNIETKQNTTLIDCPKCGQFFIRRSDDWWLRKAIGKAAHNDENYYNTSLYDNDYKKQCSIISSHIYFERAKWKEQNWWPTIDLEYLTLLLQSGIIPRTPEEKINSILKFINEKSSFFGEKIRIIPQIIYSDNETELINLASELEKEGLILLVKEGNEGSRWERGIEYKASLTIKGITHIKDLKDNSSKEKCFVAMWFHPSMDKIWQDVIKPACEETGYKPIRVDELEFNDDITDHIITEIQESYFVIADLTGFRGGVYYEAGYARGLGKEVLLCCRKDYKIKVRYEKGEKMVSQNGPHFDVNHLNTLYWNEDNLDSFKQKLKSRILSTVGRGKNT